MTPVEPRLNPVLLLLENAGMEEVLAGLCDIVPGRKIADPETFLDSSMGQAARAIVMPGHMPLTEWMWRLPKLGLIACIGTGYDGIDLERAASLRIAVTAGIAVNSNDVADMAIGLLLAAVRHIARGDRQVRGGQWNRPLTVPMARSVWGSRCGIVGLGSIGSAIAERLTGFGCSVSWWGPRPKPDAKWPRADSLAALARDNDMLIVAAPATPDNRGLIDAEILRELGPQGYLVNISRGELVDEDALVQALRGGGIAGAGLDVYIREPNDGSKWKDIETVVLTPHVAAWAEKGITRACRMCADNVAAFLQGAPLLSPVRRRDGP